MIVEIREYQDRVGRSPFGEWRSELNSQARKRVTTALYRLGLGNFSNVKGVGAGLFECKIDFGPGYRVYFGKDGERLVILLGGGTKKRQENDIRQAMAHWARYKQQKGLRKAEK